jgi:hypothetical protein
MDTTLPIFSPLPRPSLVHKGQFTLQLLLTCRLAALFLACWRGHLEIAQALHSAGGDVGREDKEGRSMEVRAVEWNQTRVVAWLKSLRGE